MYSLIYGVDFFGNLESRGSTHDMVIPILVGDKFSPTEVRVVGVDAEFLSVMCVIYKRRLTVDFGKLYFLHVQGGMRSDGS